MEAPKLASYPVLAQEIITEDWVIGLTVCATTQVLVSPLTFLGPYMSKHLKPKEEDESDDDF